MTVRRRAVVVIACALAAFVGLGAWAWHELAPGVLWYSDIWRQVRMFSQPFAPYVQRLRDAGEPVTFEALEDEMPPDTDNAAGEVEAAWTWAVETAGPEKSWTALGPWRTDWTDQSYDTATPDEIEALRHFLDGLRPFVERTDAALRRSPLRYPLALDATGLPDSKWVPRIQSVTRLLGAHANVARRPADRVAAVACSLRLGRRITDGDATMNLMIGTAVTGMAMQALRRNLEGNAFDVSAARAELDVALASQWLPRMHGLLRHERVVVIAAYDAALNGKLPPSDDGSPPPPRSDVLRPDFAATYVSQCEAFSRALKWGQLPYGEWRRRWEAVMDETATRRSAFVPIVPRKLAEQFCRTDAATRLARIALALAEHHATHHEFPASLDELAPALKGGVPLDPYTDASFVYERTDRGARISSVGRLPEETKLDAATLRERCLVWELKR